MGVPHSPRLNSHQEHQPQLCDCNSKPKSSCLVNLDPVVDVPLPVQLLLKDKLHPNRPDQQPPPPTLHQHAQTLQPLLLQLNNSKAPLVVACWETSPAPQQAWQSDRPLATQSPVSSEDLPLQQLSNLSRTLLLRREMRLRRTAGDNEAVRSMPSSSLSAWTRTRGTCRSVDGIWNN